MWKLYKSVHSKDRSYICSLCKFSLSRIDILERHVNHFLKDRMSKTCKSCDYDFSERVNMKEHTEPLHIKKRLDKISICDHAYFQKSEMWKHHKSFHSKDRSHNCSNYEFSSSKIDILERHVNHFLKDMMSQNLLKLWLWFLWKSQYERAY